jgi:hypothetical protein
MRANGASAAEKSDHRHRRLLRLHRERPCSHRAAEEGDKLAPFQSIELHSIPTGLGRTARYRISRDQSAGMIAIMRPINRSRSVVGQNLLLPQRNTDDRFSPINRHYLTVTFLQNIAPAFQGSRNRRQGSAGKVQP